MNNIVQKQSLYSGDDTPNISHQSYMNMYAYTLYANECHLYKSEISSGECLEQFY